jgi:hypothetical protein
MRNDFTAIVIGLIAVLGFALLFGIEWGLR